MTIFNQPTENRAPTERDILGKGFDFDAIQIRVASPEEILAWSHGEVLKPETFNYRTQKPERDGLFDERIFGPVKDFECYCGKYRKIRFEGVICDKCGVEVTRSIVRRERLGHIDLAFPVVHIWYLRGIPSILSLALDIPVSDLEKVIYFAAYIVMEVSDDIRERALQALESEYKNLKSADDFKEGGEKAEALDLAYKEERQVLTGLKPKMIISEGRYQDLSLKYGSIVRVGIGAEAVLELLEAIDLETTLDGLEKESLAEGESETSSRKSLRRLRLFRGLKANTIQPAWFVLKRLPILPPDLRPMVQLDGGRFAASDLNDLYRRVLNRNNRLKRLVASGAPEVIQRNERRMLQEAVDALIDNSNRRGRAVTSVNNKRRLRSLSDMLRGKQGRFRQNLLGKRVDYSGRSVIVVGPELKLYQCGLPKSMAMEIFKPFVIGRLIREGYVHNVKNATRLIEQGEPFVWDILEDVTKNHFVLLNRAPTLHRLGIQAFQPVLVDGKAIQIHPLVCHAFNADFDGDQMAVHVPLSRQAQWEASQIIRSSHNLRKPASGDPIVGPRLDMIWGLYYMTSQKEKALGEGRIFSCEDEAVTAYQLGQIEVQAKIKLPVGKPVEGGESGLIETTVGRVIFNRALPTAISYRNLTIDNKMARKIVLEVLITVGRAEAAITLDALKSVSFEHVTASGMTFSVDDIEVPKDKKKVIEQADLELAEIGRQYARGLLTDSERSTKTIELWTKVNRALQEQMLKQYERQNPLFMMVASGAKGSVTQLAQLSGMKGLMVNPEGQIIEIPIRSNFKEGLSVYEYFISTHGSRKGRTDTALRTSVAGYLTRRLVDVAQDAVVTEKDCRTKRSSLLITAEVSEFGTDFVERASGRTLAKTIGKFKIGTLITSDIAKRLKDEVKEVSIRNLLDCQAERGVCQLCYGVDLATGELVEIAEVVGIMAAQAIGEPGTQLTMKTFHMGGVAGEGDITSGLPRVEEIFEARRPKTPAIMAEIGGKVTLIESKESRVIRLTGDEKLQEVVELQPSMKALVKTGETIRARQPIVSVEGGSEIRAPLGGTVKVEARKITITSRINRFIDYEVSPALNLLVEDGEKVVAGQPMTEGHIDLSLGLELQGVEKIANYMIREVQNIYNSQGQGIHDKHVEIILRQMLSKVRILEPGDSSYMIQDVVDRQRVEIENESLKKVSKKPIVFQDMILGITKVALKSESFLAAASFQETTSVLVDAGTRGSIDYLEGLKENVIIGKLIPAGTGFPGKEIPESALKKIEPKLTPRLLEKPVLG